MHPLRHKTWDFLLGTSVPIRHDKKICPRNRVCAGQKSDGADCMTWQASISIHTQKVWAKTTRTESQELFYHSRIACTPDPLAVLAFRISLGQPETRFHVQHVWFFDSFCEALTAFKLEIGPNTFQLLGSSSDVSQAHTDRGRSTQGFSLFGSGKSVFISMKDPIAAADR